MLALCLGLVLALPCTTSGSSRTEPCTQDADEAPVSTDEMRRRGAEWLARRLDRVGDTPPTLGTELAGTALAIAALARSDREAHAPVIERQRALLLGAQRSDGSFGSGDERGPTTRWALAAFEESAGDTDGDMITVVRSARGFLRAQATDQSVPASRPPADDGVGRALEFLRPPSADRAQAAGSSKDAGDEALYCLAGAEFDLRSGHELLIERLQAGTGLGAGLVSGLHLPALDASLHECHLAARILARTRSPRVVSPALGERWWPDLVVATLRSLWDSREGAWSAEPGGPPSPLQTACALLALDAASPWISVDQGALARVREEGAPVYAELRRDCEACHQELQPGLAHQWTESAHASAGVGCADCHGDNHSRIFRENGRVSTAVCGTCHAREVEEFARSRHAHAEETLLSSRLFAATPSEARNACRGCHAIGTSHADGTRGSCNYCHPGHLFRASHAREPDACTTCHTGADYPQDLAFRLSKHGALYEATRDTRVAPTCATCHQPDGRHDDGFGLTLGSSGSGGIPAGIEPPVRMRAVPQETLAANRADMVNLCADCHSRRFAEDQLAQADRLKREGDGMLAEAADLLRALCAEGRLPFEAGAPLDELLHDPALRTAPILERFYRMWRFDYATTWKGAYHSSPSVANLQSSDGPSADLEFIRAEAARLRNEK